VFKLTIKNLRARKFRLITTGFAIILGVAFVAGTLVLTDTVSSTFNNLFSDVFKTTDAQVRAEEPFDGANDGGGSTRPRVDASLVDLVAKVPGVKVAEGNIFGFAQVVGKDGKAIGDPGQGAPTFGGNWAKEPALNAYTIFDGRAPRADDEIVLDNHSAKEGKYHVGDTATILTKAGANKFTVVGLAKFGKYDSAAGSTTVSFTLAAAEKYVAEPGKYDAVSVIADDGVSQEQVKADIAKVLPKGDEVITGAELTKENQDDAQSFIKIFRNAMLAFALIALFVGSFIIYNTFSILVAQRTREMALLRAIGASRRQVTRSLLVEALAIGLIASVVGIAAGVGLAVGLKALLGAFGADIPANGLTIAPGTIIFSLVLGTAVSVFASWFPARRGARVPPIAAMRDVAIERPGRPRLRIAMGVITAAIGLLSLTSGLGGGDGALGKVGLGALLILLAVTFLGPLAARPVSGLLGRPVASLRGTSGVLARENAMRNPKRTSTTASALMIGVALVAFITIFASSAKASIDKIFNEQFTGDFVMNTNTFGFGGVSPQMADELRQQPELSAVSSLRVANAKFNGKGVQLQSFDAVQMGKIADIGVLKGQLSDLGKTDLAVQVDKAEKEHWTIGTKVPVQFSDTGVQDLTVKVIYEHKELANNYFVDNSVIDANVRDVYDSIVFAKTAPGVSVSDARPVVERITDTYPNVKVQDRKEFIDSQSAQINQMLALIIVLLMMAVIIALFGIANTLALSIVERTRELGLLRAVGMTRRQLKSMVRWEAVLIALFGAVGGLGVGVFFGWSMIQALKDDGFTAFNVPIAPLVIIIVVAGLAAVVAAALPARRAAKLDVLKAIAAE
jgi:putative ABC transport system permease protein